MLFQSGETRASLVRDGKQHGQKRTGVPSQGQVIRASWQAFMTHGHLSHAKAICPFNRGGQQHP